MNWTTIISDLLKRDYTYSSIGRELDVTSAAVRALMNNVDQQPRWVTGNKLLALHRKVMRKYPRINDAA